MNRADQIELFYGQSWRVVEYLIDTYGGDKMAELLATIKAGNTADQALILKSTAPSPRLKVSSLLQSSCQV